MNDNTEAAKEVPLACLHNMWHTFHDSLKVIDDDTSWSICHKCTEKFLLVLEYVSFCILLFLIFK